MYRIIFNIRRLLYLICKVKITISTKNTSEIHFIYNFIPYTLIHLLHWERESESYDSCSSVSLWSSWLVHKRIAFFKWRAKQSLLDALHVIIMTSPKSAIKDAFYVICEYPQVSSIIRPLGTNFGKAFGLQMGIFSSLKSAGIFGFFVLVH